MVYTAIVLQNMYSNICKWVSYKHVEIRRNALHSLLSFNVLAGVRRFSAFRGHYTFSVKLILYVSRKSNIVYFIQARLPGP